MDKSKIFPGYFIEKPLFQAEKNFRRLLSEQDSCFHTNQVSLIFLEKHIEENSLDNEEFIRSLSHKYNISAGNKNWEVTKLMIARSYVVQTYNIQEIFFKEFNKEYQKYKGLTTWKKTIKKGDSDKNLDPYSQLILNIPTSVSKIFAATPESHLIHYYRLVRNGIVHKSEISLEKPTEYYKKNISTQLEHFKKYYDFLPDGELPAPNLPNSLNHNDFFIYSRCLKNLINLIINACNLTVSEIFSFEMSNESFKKTMRKHSDENDKSKNKMIDALSTYFRTKYGNLKLEKEQFVDLYLNNLK
jgi:hypothetical protein